MQNAKFLTTLQLNASHALIVSAQLHKLKIQILKAFLKAVWRIENLVLILQR